MRGVPNWPPKRCFMRLVVLDDNDSVNEIVASVARRRGWEVKTTTRQAEFRALVRDFAPDGILLDLQLDETDGIEELHFLQAERYPGAVVLMSGFDSRVLASAQKVGDSLGLMMPAIMEKPTPSARIAELLAEIEQLRTTGGSSTRAARTRAGKITARDVVDALDAGHMELHLQPIVSAVGHAVQRAEALIRWRDPVRGSVPPGLFVPVAETDETAIDRLTMWVAHTGATHYRKLAAAGTPVQICINLSGHNIRALDFPDRLTLLRERLALPQDAIGLEITETVAMTDFDSTTAVLARLRLKGFPVAIDDFGTGHSSLIALRQMPFSALKIDRSFISEIQTSSDSLTIVRSVIQLAHDMNLSSVAEGVESSDAAQTLTELGIDSMQGYYFSKPLPFDSFIHWLRDWSQIAHA